MAAQAAAGASGSLEQMVWAVTVVSRYLPGATCLTQALAAQALLTQSGFPSQVEIGVAKDRRSAPPSGPCLGGLPRPSGARRAAAKSLQFHHSSGTDRIQESTCQPVFITRHQRPGCDAPHYRRRSCNSESQERNSISASTRSAPAYGQSFKTLPPSRPRMHRSSTSSRSNRSAFVRIWTGFSTRCLNRVSSSCIPAKPPPARAVRRRKF